MAILAGCSFISRMSKNFMERCKVFDSSSESYDEFIDEKEKPDENEFKNAPPADPEKLSNNIVILKDNSQNLTEKNIELQKKV